MAADRRQHRAGRARPEGRTGSLAVVTPWYPCPQRPHAGSFVRTATAAVAERFARVDVLNGEDWPSTPGEFRHDLVRTAYERLAGPPGAARAPVLPEHTAEGWRLTRVPVPVRPRAPYADWARAHESALRAVLPGGVIDADVVHGHTGVYGGWAACRLARPGARIVVTEHASFLPAVLRQPPSRELYRQVVERADAFLCVSPWLRERLAQSFPGHAGKFRVVPNAVDVAAVPVRPRPVRELRRWLFVGNLVPAKGVPLLLDAFAAAAVDDPRLELTLVGPGDAEAVRRRAAELGVGHRVAVRGPVEPHEVVGVMHDHDLLVHPSTFETFGMTVVEAVASGMPVLVTRCGGPEQTLAGLEGAAGRLVDLADGPGPLLEGYRALAAGVGRLDPARARAAIERRYGLAAVGARLAEVYAEAAVRPSAPPSPGVAAAPAVPAAPSAPAGAGAGADADGRSGRADRPGPPGGTAPGGRARPSGAHPGAPVRGAALHGPATHGPALRGPAGPRPPAGAVPGGPPAAASAGPGDLPLLPCEGGYRPPPPARDGAPAAPGAAAGPGAPGLPPGTPRHPAAPRPAAHGGRSRPPQAPRHRPERHSCLHPADRRPAPAAAYPDPPRPGAGAVLLLALGATRQRAVVEDARFLAERGVPVVVVAGRREVAEAAAEDPRVWTVLLPPGGGLLGGWQLWRAARRGLRGLLPRGPRPRIAEAVVCDAPAAALAWHLARAEPGLPLRWGVARGAYGAAAPAGRPGTPADRAEAVR
ncbi:glycosyltransferase [Streptacidiphilus sp. ASG 303]|uniref:glycosyltransferase n=1 Tax=Streptacidiphilus sp. ASG 303 TaxID=2896847 RepID=UPI001E3756CD|nr:glycosyltransferase [Streptacidiphilus sp. ASG 303]MCD0484718.1 glycosyltransferase [Streptacidiphilus sp. ASG 303]